jgi:lipopolysaccharide/colanic/teichoic acid biosynthesis glycosyltransferase
LADVVHLNGAGGPSFKVARDPRVTRVGALLRRTSLDELPQLINVLKGEMSLVGPRPLFAYEFDRIEAQWIKRRCSVKPGLTGLWQVSGRSDLPFEARIQLDLQYIDTWSIGLDLKILARTVPAVILGKGAV